MPTRFCLKNIGDPSSKNIAKATAKKTGDKINSAIKANNRLIINVKLVSLLLWLVWTCLIYTYIIRLLFL